MLRGCAKLFGNISMSRYNGKSIYESSDSRKTIRWACRCAPKRRKSWATEGLRNSKEIHYLQGHCEWTHDKSRYKENKRKPEKEIIYWALKLNSLKLRKQIVVHMNYIWKKERDTNRNDKMFKYYTQAYDITSLDLINYVKVLSKIQKFYRLFYHYI